jgi:transcription-repair coupling factor (superfamily II helicase)
VDLKSFLKNNFSLLTTENCRIYNLTGSSPALFLALEQRPFVAIEKDEEKARTLTNDVHFYRSLLSGDRVLFLPDSDGPASSGSRARIINDLKKNDSIITSSNNLKTTLWEINSLEHSRIFLKKGSLIPRSQLEESLVKCGYKKVPMVVEKGEYSLRGWIMDIFPSTSDVPLRIEFFGDELEQMKKFDVETQRSAEVIFKFLIFPAVEPDYMRCISDIFTDRRYFCFFSVQDKAEFPQNTLFLSRYSFKSPPTPDNPPDPLPTGQGWNIDEIEAFSDQTEPRGKDTDIDAGILSLKGLGILPEERRGLDDLPENIKKMSASNRIVIIASSDGQSERLKDIFREKDIIVPSIDRKELIDFPGNISITVGGLSSGLFINGFLILTEKELFGERLSFRPIIKSKVANLLLSLDDIIPGDFVVHIEHGIGRFSGIVRQKVDETELELMMIEYVEGRLYIPLYNIKNISKYHSQEGIIPKIDRMGGKTWQRKKERVWKKVREMASRLLALYADRKIVRGFAFSPDTVLHREFDSFFAYEETHDQLKAIEDIKRSMESDSPMDMLICGDVGYGKTEVAMRAAFKAVYDNRQVAVLVPTTILAEQHYRTFTERFSGFPIKIDFICRFKTKKQIDITLKGVADGEIDIIIGTHGLLSKKVAFNRMGLLIVDEEHRFGVGQKERIKEISKNIDVLNLTATPIPRTMHMALSGIREISVIETPPEERLAVKSIVTMFNDSVIKESIEGELQRNGQVFFVNNRIHNIGKIAEQIRKLFPMAEIGVAHGQLPERELEKIMLRFFNGDIDVLVSTSIVGSGLDIPRANTIIINRADKMGLADLYQLRGRVGRSNLKAYAVFLVPGEALMTEEARKRLQAVQEMSYLGAGFRLALKDLEIRGAGNIFGHEQSGHIAEIGFDLYMNMLEKAVAELKGIEIKEEPDPVIELKTSAFIPEGYIEDITLRLSCYRRIASLKTEKEIEDFQLELNDRFGSPPEEVYRLLDVMRMKVLARELSITKVHEIQGKVSISFSEDTMVQPQHLILLQNSKDGLIKILPDGFELSLKGVQFRKVFEEVYKMMQEILKNVSRA